jgi:hypothetical protein
MFAHLCTPCSQYHEVWMLGNLARASYVGSSDYMWPFSYSKCNSRTRLSQEINACSKVNHYGMNPYSGRGSPEIDIIESMQGAPGKLPNTHIHRPYQSTSLQIAPGIEIDRPVLGDRPHEVCSGASISDRTKHLISTRADELSLSLSTGTLVSTLGVRK